VGDTLARLLRACATGYGCRSVISPEGLGRQFSAGRRSARRLAQSRFRKGY